MVPFTSFAMLFLRLLVHKATAGGCISSIRDPDSDSDAPDNEIWANLLNPGMGVHQARAELPNSRLHQSGYHELWCPRPWATVFYSMGARTFQARQGLRDQLTPKGVMFNDALGFQWWEPVNARSDFRLEQPERQAYFRNLFAIAMAQLSFGEVFLATKSRISEAEQLGDPGIF
ncbi:hypothetical protein F4801DRAFT_576431 [Xylaria longipes]|nr:hypothetical protein F4801DRAFT_576431 [Xylaria longipes]